MLDYAPNATPTWKVESLQAWFEAECERRNVGSAAALEAAFGVTDPDSYWTEVLAIEVKQYVDAEGRRQTIVPRGRSNRRRQGQRREASAGPSRAWDEQSLIAEITAAAVMTSRPSLVPSSLGQTLTIVRE